ncbi:MAG: hypothetical protein JJE30_13290 [Desulfuromonadales bacterium]|nr:hypothetical protein [Desulfuromonadales bacterium]
MEKKDASFWAEIKSLNDRLASDPDSFCFARLSDIYLKVGLVADALHTARTGVARHPGYLAGQRALAMACNAGDQRDECRVILEKVTATTPEDMEAQTLLATLYVESGDTTSAVRTYTALLDFRPDDVQFRAQLETLQKISMSEAARSAAVTRTGSIEVPDQDDEILELDESDIIYDEEPSEEEPEPAAPVATKLIEPGRPDPLSTLTLAELYEQQGFIAKALDIYRTILADEPGNTRLHAKIAQLEQQVAVPESVPEQPVVPDFAAEPVPFAPAAAEEAAPPMESSFVVAPVPEAVHLAEPEPFTSAAFENTLVSPASPDFSPVHKEADTVLGTLDGWLENIRRIKACR